MKIAVETLTMLETGNVAVWVCGLLAVTAVLLALHHCSPEARERRRRRRSHGRVVSRSKRPAVVLNVKKPKA
jgi:hypothetical protein